MKRSWIRALAAAGALYGATSALAGPCSVQIAEVQQYIERSGAATGPTAPQSLGAQLHHQPTPQSVEGAETKARAAAAAALERARRADAGGDASACADALDEAKRLYGLE